MKTILAPVFSLLLFAAPAFSQEKSPAEKLIELDFNDSTLATARAAFNPFLEQLRKQGVPEQGLAEISAAADAFFQKTFSDPALKVELAKLYEDKFTKEELEQILAFYNTPVGRKALTVLPAITKESVETGQKFAEKHKDAFQKELAAILDRYPRTPKAPATPPSVEKKPAEKNH